VEALFETVSHLSHAGVEPVGFGHDADEAYRPATFSLKGVRVAVLGASRVFPRPYWAAGRPGPGLASAYDEEALLSAVVRAKQAADVVVVAVHWGTELMPCPDDDVVALGHALVEAGASVVLGSHPHVLQPLVRRSGGLIAFSLGNFVFHRRSSIDGDTGVLEVRFDGGQILEYRLHPHRLDEGPPHRADPTDSARILSATEPAACGL
jgi:poly-gamma-glutamate capsule biosynthesis protein CapA/YwtB (metallophosphatase superfamily)